LIFSPYFILKLDKPFRNEENLKISFFSKVQILVLGVKKGCFFLQFLVDILPLGSGDPHIFAEPDPGIQNLADPTDPFTEMNQRR